MHQSSIFSIYSKRLFGGIMFSKDEMMDLIRRFHDHHSSSHQNYDNVNINPSTISHLHSSFPPIIGADDRSFHSHSLRSLRSDSIDSDHIPRLSATESTTLPETEKRNGVTAPLSEMASLNRLMKKRKSEIVDDEDWEKKSKRNSNSSDYIHVRARRGQATDSHSLAERARREKINTKMKCLQEMVPGCSKAIGKAGMLDEIINYVHSLQRQVEFLSMKLACLNPNLDKLMKKEIEICEIAAGNIVVSSNINNLSSEIIFNHHQIQALRDHYSSFNS